MALDINGLNAPQREAVLHTEGPLLVLAGAGSGKTRVLTYRIAHLLEDKQVAPWEILAITFTNKAAAEMRERLFGLVGSQAQGMWVATFHSMCVRILRANAEVVGFTNSFTIYDDTDTKNLIKEIMAELNIDPKKFPLPSIRGRISQAKNELVVPSAFDAEAEGVDKLVSKVYTRYQERLRQANSFDFDDLLLYTFLLLKNHPDVLRAHQERFRYIMVDEYQDTNHAQYLICKLLAAHHKNIMVVGDDDQSIYSWRGADLRNILDFEKDYSNAHTVKLEENYRSVGNVLAAANAVIANNEHRKSKTLFTQMGEGEKISVYMASDERDEGRWIASEIESRHAQGQSYNDMALFYRTNAQSRILEDMLLRAGVPYKIVGGTKFFDRAEIKDVMAYLTLVVNPLDTMAAKRVINVPRRGIGKTTVERIQEMSFEHQISFLDAVALAAKEGEFRSNTKTALQGFIDLIQEITNFSGDLRSVVEMIIHRSGLIAALQLENTDEARGRIENIQELLSVVDEFIATHESEEESYPAPTAPGGELQEFLDSRALGSGVEALAAGERVLAAGVSGGGVTGEVAAAAAGQVAVAGGVAGGGSTAAGDATGAGDVTAAQAAPDTQDAADDFIPFLDGFDMVGEELVSLTQEGQGAVSSAGAQEPAREFFAHNLGDFIEWVTLRTDLDTLSEENSEFVTMMTVHASKGLEFDTVFVAGMEEGLFPHMRGAVIEAAHLEEERRLAYVAITRARKYLYLSCAATRQIFGETSNNPTSRFLNEIPLELRQTIGVGSAGFEGVGWEKRGSRRGIAGSGSEFGAGRVSHMSSSSVNRKREVFSSPRGKDVGKKAAANTSFAVGDKVDHKTFGVGKVVKVAGDALEVRFERTGQTKKLMKDYAPIVKIS